MAIDPLDFHMKIRQGIVFFVAHAIQLIPLALFSAIEPADSLMLALPLLLFYAGSKTGLLLINGLGKVTNAYRLTQLALLVGTGAALGLGLTAIPIIDEIAALILGLSASVVLVAFQTVYYLERTVWHWFIGNVELLGGALYVAVMAGLMWLVSRFNSRWTFLVLALFLGLALWLLHRFPNFIHQGKQPLTRAGSQSLNDLELFMWLTLLVFSLRYVRQFATRGALLLLGIVLLGFFTFLARIILRQRITIRLPWWHIVASFLNGIVGTFAMLYLLFATDPKASWFIPISYTAYGLGFLGGQFFRRPLQKLLKPLSDLTIQLLGFVLGSWLLVFPLTLPLGLFIIGFIGTANSILLSHAAFIAPAGDLQNRLMVKYRNVNLGSILAQFLMLLLIGIVSLKRQGHFLTLLTRVNQGQTAGLTHGVVLTMGWLMAVLITLGAIAVMLLADKVNEQPLYAKK
ncbi:MAG: hypothetical protein LKF36_00425 [Lactobacillus sp.]|jgi:hypothetical protein|nr:hypothetical protein [Lactobacillus sp.]